jgi:AcrR family transcriptional regulator
MAAIAQTTSSTRELIMDTAEALFATHGFHAASMRDIAKAAGIHVGSISYHFESKEGLLLEIYRRHCRPMNQRRGELLREAERIADPSQRLEAIVRAYILPAFSSGSDLAGGGARFTRLRAVMSAEGNEAVRDVIASTFDETSHALIDAIGRCLPDQPRDVIVWRCHFLLGGLYYTLVNPDRVTRLSRGTARGDDFDQAVDQLVLATVAALKATAK